jgi:hypothetical protein
MDVQVGQLVVEADRLGYGNNATIITIILYVWGDKASSARADAPGFVVVPTTSAWDCGDGCNPGCWYPVTARMPKPPTANAPMSTKIRITSHLRNRQCKTLYPSLQGKWCHPG